MADFDLSLIVRGEDQGASATGERLAKSLNDVAAAQRGAAAGAGALASKTGEVANAEAGAAKAADNLAQANSRAAIQQARLAKAGGDYVRSAGAMRAGSLQLGQQIQDVGVQLSSGTDIIRVFAQQAGQTAFAVQQMGGKFAAVASFVGGPFGSLLLAGVSILATFAFTSKKAEDATKAFGEGMDFASRSARDLIDTIGALEAAQKKANQTTLESERAKLRDADASLVAARAKREEIKALLETQIATQGISGGLGAPTDLVQNELAGTRKLLADLDKTIISAEGLRRESLVPLIRRSVAASTDAATAASYKFDQAEIKLRKTYGQTGDLAKYRAELTKITDQRERDTKAAREAAKAPRAARTASGAINGRDVAALLGTTPNGGGDGSRTKARNTEVGGALNSYHVRGQAIDIPLTINGKPLTKDYIRSVLEPAGVGIRELLGPGDKGHSDHFHIAFDKTPRGDDVIARDAERKQSAAERKAVAAQRAAEQLASFGQRAGETIARINSQFDEQPTLVDNAAKSVRELDALIADLGKKKPPGFEKLIADAQAVKPIIEQGLVRPYDDFIREQEQSFKIAQSLTAGRTDEAEALKIIFGLEKQMGPLTPARRDGVLATVQALRAEERQLQRNREIQQGQLDQLKTVKDALRDVFDDPAGGLASFPDKVIKSVAKLKLDGIFEKLFGNTFRQLEDQITGADKAKDAAGRMADAIDTVSDSSATVVEAFNAVANAANGAAGAQGGAGGLGGGGKGGIAQVVKEGLGGYVSQSLARFGGGRLPSDGGSTVDANGDIVVTGRRKAAAPGISGILDKLSKGIGISDKAAGTIGRIGGKAFGGAATGSLVQSVLEPLGKKLGFKTSATGAKIGGAIGSFIPIPGGEIIGAAIGSIVGGLFKKTKTGSAVISSLNGAPTLGGKLGSSLSGSASNVQAGLQNIAQALGGGLGSFKVAIGTRNGGFRVDPTGNAANASSKRPTGLVYDGKDEGAAVAAAILAAIKQGAVTGLSAAVQRALASSTDLDKALREALGVQQLEDLIGGLGGSLARAFKQFDVTAAERIRLATTYGLDIVKVEKINGEERVRLIDDITKQRLSALVDLQKSLKFGDLYEGDAQGRRKALLDEIANVRADAEKGVEGANDKLAGLFATLLQTSRDAFGTAGGEYSGDRSMVTTGVDSVIATEQARIAAAADYNNAALAAANENNVLTNETNALLARTNALLSGGGGVASATGGAADPFSGGGGRLRETAIDVRNY